MVRLVAREFKPHIVPLACSRNEHIRRGRKEPLLAAEVELHEELPVVDGEPMNGAKIVAIVLLNDFARENVPNTESGVIGICSSIFAIP